MREITLIGGKFHREKVKIENNQRIIRMPIPPCAGWVCDGLPEIHEREYIEYAQIHSIFGEYGIIPDNVFFEKDSNVVEFLRKLVLDYVR